MTLIKSISGIRGTIGGKVGETLSPLDTAKFAAAFGTWVVQTTGNPKIVVGRDARISGKMLSDIVVSTLQALGISVVDLGLATTPTVEIAVPNENAGGGIILTASHNPINWNALKLLNAKGEFISAIDGQKVLELAEKESFNFVEVQELGKVEKKDYLDFHIQHILSLGLIDVKAIRKRNFSIVIDAINSVGGIAVPELLKALGVENIKVLFGEPNGHFAHNPEPLPEHLTQISAELKTGNFDLGIVVDPDVDRLAFMNENGTAFGEEYTLVAIADYVLQFEKGNTVSNMSSTQALGDVTKKYGFERFEAAVGEVNVVTEMKRVKATIGGEGNGGVIYPKSHYGRDAMVGIALFLSHLAKTDLKMSELKNSYPSYAISKNKIQLSKDTNLDKIFTAIQEQFSHLKQNSADGLKIYDEQNATWLQLRKSNTEPIIRIYAEAPTSEQADGFAKQVISAIQAL